VSAALQSLQSPALDRVQRRENEARLNDLSELILQPLLSSLHTPRLRVAADGALHYLPIGILPSSTSGNRRLMEAIEIVNIPSTTALDALGARNPSADRQLQIVLFADPVFEPTDSRLRQVLSPEPTIQGMPNITRIPWTGREASLIENLVTPDQRHIERGFDASRRNLLSLDLSQFRILHLATHGLIDARYPELSALALSFYDRDGHAVDGMIRLSDIYGLDLAADLVVLSACDTALGLELRGESLLGLTQGFMYAGSRNLLTSLWPVPDQVTAELMAKFYEFLLNDHLSPATALRRAQLGMSSSRRSRDPYYWGAFVLLGDGR